MTNSAENNKRIAKNTLFLYIRMLILMAVTFFTSRVILKSLGVVDFGIHNVVGGLALMFVFFRSSLANVTQRDLNIEIGKGNTEKIRYVFRLHQSIYIIIAIFVAIIAETIGLWFVCNKLVIPANRMTAALWVYHFTVISLCITIISVVYDSVLIARENMKIYSYVGIIEGCAKLLIAYIIAISPFDHLVTYGVLLFLLALGLRIFYAYYCSRHYAECNFSFTWNKIDVKRTFTFISWNTIGCLVYIINEQGINMILNMFFGPVVNAARAISYQVSGAIGTFANNFYTSVRPQMTKSYANGDYKYLMNLFYSSSKLSVYLLWIFILPTILCIDQLLELWLGTVPQDTNIFTQLVMIYVLINTLNTPIWSLALAIGELKRYILYGNTIYFMAFPISYILLKMGFPATSVFITMIIIRCIYIGVVLNIVCEYLRFATKNYLFKVILPCIYVILTSSTICYFCTNNMERKLTDIILIFIFSLILNIVIIYTIGITNGERTYFKKIVSRISKKLN